ncbi:hypothetical protein MRB53_010535 [Persea americana]|uniref:Uncharacterized protein n=1 Tax=Persea americana TaxID=3435 RepID=A0ACC2LSW9_PERAE|nr:hypothetical protein MRB53_010535 [Persea americana]
MKKKQSMDTKATDSKAVTKLQRTLSTTENSTSGHRENMAQLGVRTDKSRWGHRKMDDDECLAHTQKSNPSHREIEMGDQILPMINIFSPSLFLCLSGLFLLPPTLLGYSSVYIYCLFINCGGPGQSKCNSGALEKLKSYCSENKIVFRICEL